MTTTNTQQQTATQPNLTWDTATVAPKANKTNYINIGQDGSYSIRILGNPRLLTKHWVDIGGRKRCVNGDASGRLAALSKVEGSGVSEGQTKYACLALDVDTGTVGIMEFGTSVFNQIVNIKNNAKLKVKDVTKVTFLIDVLDSRKTNKYNVQVLERHTDAFVPEGDVPDMEAYARMSDDEFLDTLGVPKHPVAQAALDAKFSF